MYDLSTSEMSASMMESISLQYAKKVVGEAEKRLGRDERLYDPEKSRIMRYFPVVSRINRRDGIRGLVVGAISIGAGLAAENRRARRGTLGLGAVSLAYSLYHLIKSYKRHQVAYCAREGSSFAYNDLRGEAGAVFN